MSKAIDKAAGAEREVVGRYQPPNGSTWNLKNDKATPSIGATGHSDRAASLDITAPATEAARQWQGWGTALKPALEPITVARKPFKGTVAANVLEHGTGAINVDGCRVDALHGRPHREKTGEKWSGSSMDSCGSKAVGTTTQGRFPANLIHDGSEEVVRLFPESKDGVAVNRNRGEVIDSVCGFTSGHSGKDEGYGGGGSAARFFYCAKASRKERGEGNNHPTVKPLALMRYLVRLVTPPGGVVLDPFMGSGTTILAAAGEGFRGIGMELEVASCEIAQRRVQGVLL